MVGGVVMVELSTVISPEMPKHTFWAVFCCPTLRSHHTVKFTLISNKTQLASYVSQLYVEKKNLNIFSKLNILHYFESKKPLFRSTFLDTLLKFRKLNCLYFMNCTRYQRLSNGFEFRGILVCTVKN